MTSNNMKITFIIASVDRDSQLQKCIATIEKAHEYKKDILVEILVVIQKAAQKKDIFLHYPDLTTIFYIDQLGLSRARNYAIKKSSGDFLVFLDDDASVADNFIEVLSRQVSLCHNVNAFCGRLIDSAQSVPFSRLFYHEDQKKLRRVDYQYFMGSAHVLSARVIKKIGCYDERFGVGGKYHGSEESDMFFRLKAAGEKVFYLPNLIFFHPIPDNPPEYVYKYAYAIAAMLTKNCLNDKKHSITYSYIIFKRVAKAWIRILQKVLFKGIFVEKDNRYHYGTLIRGTFKGINDFIAEGR